MDAVASGSYEAAAGFYAQCTDARQKKACSSKMGGSARNQIQYAANNGDCNRAKTIAAAAQSMGVPAAALAKPLGPCR